MGYYTDFTVSVVSGVIDESELESLLTDFTGYRWVENLTLNAKWYDHKRDMLKISKLRPDLTLMLMGEGEERGDIWIEYYKNGKYQRKEPPPIVIPPLDENDWE